MVSGARSLLAFGLVVAALLAIGTAIASPGAQKKPNETSPPTPFPKVPTLAVTPVPTSAISEREYRQQFQAGRPAQQLPTPRPDAPFRSTVYMDGGPDTTISTRESTAIIVGAIRQVLPARWSTADGLRPANPFAEPDRYTIFRPVVVDVEQSLKGPPSQTSLLLFAFGGTVGPDSAGVEPPGKYTFQEGERAVLFLRERSREPASLVGRALWDVKEHYTVSPDGLATSGRRTVPLQQLLAEVSDTQRQP